MFAAIGTFIASSRSLSRKRPRLGIRHAVVTAKGLYLELRNEGSTPALDIQLVVRGTHDGALLHLLETIGAHATLRVAEACPPGDAFEVEFTYRNDSERRYSARRTLRRSGLGPVRIVHIEDVDEPVGASAAFRRFIKG